MRRVLSFLLPIAGLAIFAYVVYKAGPGNIASVVRSVDPRQLALTPLLILAIMLVRGLRWRYLINKAGLPYSLSRSTLVWTIGFFASAVTPAKAGDAIRAFYVRNDTGCSLGQAFLTVFMDRLWDLLFILISGMATVLIFSHYYIDIPSLWIVIAGALGIMGVVALITNRSWMKKLLGPLFNTLVPKKYKDEFALNFNTFYDSLTSFGRGWKHHVVAFALTLACWSLIFLLACFIARMLGIDVPARYLVLIWPIVTLVELLPISISGLGTRDATMIYFLGIVGVGSAQAVALSLAYLVIGTYATAVFGLVFWLRHPVNTGGDAA